MPTKTVEEFIEVIYTLEQKHGIARTTGIASTLGLRPASVTEMLQKLGGMDLVNYKPYYGVTLTAEGKMMAKRLMHTHKTLADFLEIIGVDRKDAEIDACQIEHHVTPKTMENLNKFVEFVRDAPQDPKWLEHFRHFCETGERRKCDRN